MKPEVVYVGVDVAKASLDVALGQESWRVIVLNSALKTDPLLA